MDLKLSNTIGYKRWRSFLVSMNQHNIPLKRLLQSAEIHITAQCFRCQIIVKTLWWPVWQRAILSVWWSVAFSCESAGIVNHPYGNPSHSNSDIIHSLHVSFYLSIVPQDMGWYNLHECIASLPFLQSTFLPIFWHSISSKLFSHALYPHKMNIVTPICCFASTLLGTKQLFILQIQCICL